MFCTFVTAMKNTGILLLLIVLAFSSCEKTIEFDLENKEPKLVVEATIENNEPPRVVLSQSFNFFSTIGIDVLSNSFVHNADVYMSNGTQTHRLKEYAVPITSAYALYYYGIDSANVNTAFKGEINKQYTLRIVVDNEEYTATTTIPNFNKQVDSIWWKPAPAVEDSTKAVVMLKVTDPKGFGNYIRYFTKQNNQPFYPGISSVFDDLVVDGTTYNIQVGPGRDRNAERDVTEGSFFNKGDTVVVKIAGIDKATFDFWRTMEYSYQSVGNPFSTPTKVLGNISNKALGYFGGYASQYDTIIIPK